MWTTCSSYVPLPFILLQIARQVVGKGSCLARREHIPRQRSPVDSDQKIVDMAVRMC